MEEFINKSKLKFIEQYDYSKINYINTRHPVNLKCKIHNYEFNIYTKSHLNSKFGGCDKCNRNNYFNELKLKSNNKFNNNFDFSNSDYIDMFTKINIKCIKHNNCFDIIPNNHLKNNNGGCNLCNNFNSNNLLIKFINKCNNKFNNNYDYSEFNYVDIYTKSKIKCKKHNNFIEISPKIHIKSINGGCPYCTHEYKNSLPKKNKEIEKKENLNIDITFDEIKKNTNFNEFKIDEEFKILNLDKCNNLYMVSNYGKIYSIKTKKILTTSQNNNGYIMVRLINDDKTSNIHRVHRLVAFVFCKNDNNKEFVDHINNNRADNCHTNLRWVSHKENMNNLKIHNNNIIKKCANYEYIIDTENFLNIGIIETNDFSDYKINIDGKIISNNNKLLTETINDGYKSISLKDKITKKYKNIRLHRLIAHIFVKKPINFNNEFVVNHIDNNRFNNNINNLEWCSAKENTRKYFQKKIHKIDIITGKTIKIYSTFYEACEDLNINKKTGSIGISKCCKNKFNVSYGYKWEIEK